MSGLPSNAAPGAPGGSGGRGSQGGGRGTSFRTDSVTTRIGVSAGGMSLEQQNRHDQANTPAIQQSLEARRQAGHSTLVINVEGNATVQIDLERKEETRQRQAEEALGGTEESSEEHTAMRNGSRGATSTATTKTSSGEDLTLKEMAASMAQIQQQMQQMQQQLSAVQASVERAGPRGNFASSQSTPSGAMQVDGVELPGNDQTATSAPKPNSNFQEPEGSRNTRYSSRLTRGPLSDGILLDGVPASLWQPPSEPENTTVSSPPTAQSTVEGQSAFSAAAVTDASFLGGALPDNARSRPATQPSTTALSRYLTRKLAGSKNGLKLL